MKNIILSLLSLSLLAFAPPPTPLYIVAGQSNAWLVAPYIESYLPGAAVLNCAKGGSSIAEWNPLKPLYQNCIAQARAMLDGGGYVLSGIFWMQGETNAGLCVDVDTWATRFEYIVRKARIDLDAPALPVVYAQLGKPFPPSHCWQDIREQQASVILGHAAMLYTWDIYRPGLHYGPWGLDVLGKRFVDKMKTTP